MIKYVERQTLKNIIAEEAGAKSDKYDWEDILIKRVDRIKEKINLSEERLIATNNNLDRLLKEIGNAELSDKIEIIINELGYAYYMQGLFDGIKEGLILKKKNFNTSI